ncbi:MAG TPA: tRNA cytidylyltransferase [Anaeromyxobacteraceae bacterium]|nr:tRNA cytidylyltransferase [Anaeromyxobacteraceae bacterium]
MSARVALLREKPPVALERASYPAAVVEVLRVLDTAGHRSWLVGGAVRDVLLRRGRKATDYDVATPARPQEVMALFPRVIPTGIEHGTVTVLLKGVPVEVTTFRGEGEYVDGRRPSSVTFHENLDADLARRDFTVNALAYDPIGRVFRDPFGGRSDLRRKILRAVGEPSARFGEDGLRPLRAARFAAQLGFKLDAATADAIPFARAVTAKVSIERVCDELSRLLVAQHAQHGLELLDRTGLLGVVLPPMEALPPAVRDHAFLATGLAEPELTVRLAVLLHVLPAGASSAHAGRDARRLLERMRFPGRVRDDACALLMNHECRSVPGRAPPPRSDVEARRWLSRVGRARAPALLALWEADVRALRPVARSRRERAGLIAFRARLSRLERRRPPLSTTELALDGRAVMDILQIPGGPVVGEALRHLLEWVLEDPKRNTPSSLRAELEAWRPQPP